MALQLEQQIMQQIRSSTRVLVCLPANPTTDAIAAGLATYSMLQKLGKKTKVVAAGFALPDSHRFLPKSEEILHDLTSLQQFVIRVDVTNKPVEQIAYDVANNTLNIYVTPKGNGYASNDVTIGSNDYMFDTIIVLDSRDLPSLGEVFEHNADFFHRTPIINIDHHPGNEQFGQINMLDITATSISEQIFQLLEHVGEPVLDEYMATQLLTGIISKTKSFKTNTVTPRSLAIASHLITNGARRDEIVKHLYQTKSIHTLQLWGRALSRLEADPEHRLVWSYITQEDFTETNTSPLDVESVIDELIVNTPDAAHIFVAYDQPQQSEHGENTGIHAIVHTAPYIKGLTIFRDWQAQGSGNFTYISLPTSSLQQAQLMIAERLKQHLG